MLVLNRMAMAASMMVLAALWLPQAHADFILGDAANYAVLVEPDLHNFQLTSDSGVTGNVGIGSPINGVMLSGGTITGNLDFSGAEASGGPNFGGAVTGSVTANVAAVTMALNTVNSLNTSLGGESGTALTISGGGQIINASSGTLDGSGNEVFTVAANGFNNNSGGIFINGTASQFVVININNGTSNESITGPIILQGGITSDHVLFNFTGTGGSLMAAANGAAVFGDFLAPDLKININSVTLEGRLFGGGSTTSNNDFQIVSGAFVDQPPVPVVPDGGATAMLLGGALVGIEALRRRLRV